MPIASATAETALPSPPPVAAPATPLPSPSRQADGWLLVLATPWANVSVDGQPAVMTPFPQLALRPGPHSVVLSHPEYQDYRRKVAISAGEVFRLNLDWASDGVRRAR
jgi:hypothetical protein